MDRRRISLALRLVRAAQRELFGRHYVKELSLLRHMNPNKYQHPSKTNWRKWRREKQIKTMPTLEEVA